jgi:hypothetical protein
VVRRLEQSRDAAAAALDTDGDRWEAFTDTLRTLVERFSADDFLGEARMLVDDHPDVVAAADRATEAFEQLMAQARAGGRLRADATTTDVRLLFAATRAAKKVEPDGWRRTLELFIDALDAKAR